MARKRAAESTSAENGTENPKKQKAGGQTDQDGAGVESSTGTAKLNGRQSTIEKAAPKGSTASNPGASVGRQPQRARSAAPLFGGLEPVMRVRSSANVTWNFPNSEHLIPPPSNPPFAGFGVKAPDLGLEFSRVIHSAYSHRTALLYSRIFTAPDISVQLGSIKKNTAAVASLPADYAPAQLEEITFEDATTVVGEDVNSEYILSVGGHGAVTVFQHPSKSRPTKRAFFLSILDPDAVTVNGFKLKSASESTDSIVGPIRRFTMLEIKRQPIFLWVSPEPLTLANEQEITQQEQDTHWIQESRQRTLRHGEKRKLDGGANSDAATSKRPAKAPRLIDLVGTVSIAPSPAAHHNAPNETHTSGEPSNQKGSIASKNDHSRKRSNSNSCCQFFRKKLREYELQLEKSTEPPTESIDLHDLEQTDYPRILNLALASVTEAMQPSQSGHTLSVVDLQEYKSLLENFDILYVRTRRLLQVQWHYYKDEESNRPRSHTKSSGPGGFYYLIACQVGRDPFRIIHDRNQSSDSFSTSSKTAGNSLGCGADRFWQENATPTWISHSSPSTADSIGILPVLNGWAIALGAALEIGPENRKLDDAFFEEAVRLINLAISGYMNFETIVAFFECHKYLDPEDLQRVKTVEQTLQTTRMDSIERWKLHLEARAQQPPKTHEYCRKYRELVKVAEKGLKPGGLAMKLPEVHVFLTPGQKYLGDEQIFVSIAAVSEAQMSIPLVENPWCITWEYAYSFARAGERFDKDFEKYRVTQPGKIFILPWLEAPEGENILLRTTSEGNHWILAVVSLDPQDKHVHMEFFDSLPGHLKERRQMIAEDVHDAVERLGWNADPDDSDAAATDLKSEESTVHWKASPLQHETWTCGYHTILNAWAYMLGLELNPEWPMGKDKQAFYNEARQLIHFVTSGLMGSDGIYSFLACHDYVLHVAAISAEKCFKKGKRFEEGGERGSLRDHIVEEVRQGHKDIRKALEQSLTQQ